MSTPAAYPPLKRLSTGVPGIAELTRGGLFRGGVYMVVGRPGSGKSVFASQVCFHRAAQGDSVLYFTLLTETHARLLANLQGFSFFDPARVGRELHFANGYTAVAEGGLEGLLTLLRNTARERHAALLIIDGMVTVEALATSQTAYRKFIQELQTWSALMGCTVLILTSASSETVGPEHTMVDGIFELSTRSWGMRTSRELHISKFRGSGYTEGRHNYRITSDGVVVYPRLEAQLETLHTTCPPVRLTTGVPGLDELVGGGFPAKSMALAFGPSGCGKTLLSMQFLAEGARRGEPGLFFGFFETPDVLVEKSNRMQLGFERYVQNGSLEIVWQPMSEAVLDELGHKLLDAVRRTQARRLVIDGLVGFQQSTPDAERLGRFFAVLGAALRALEVTCMVTEESRELYVQTVEAPVRGISATFENILFLRRVEEEGQLHRLISVLKTRDGALDDRLFRFDITDRGLRIQRPFEQGDALLTEGHRHLEQGGSKPYRGVKQPKQRSKSGRGRRR